MESAAKYRALGEWHAVRQEWRDAAERLGALVDRLDSWDTITLDYFQLSLALIEAGKRDDFTRFREQIVARYGHPTNATAAELSNLPSCCPRPDSSWSFSNRMHGPAKK